VDRREVRRCAIQGSLARREDTGSFNHRCVQECAKQAAPFSPPSVGQTSDTVVCIHDWWKSEQVDRTSTTGISRYAGRNRGPLYNRQEDEPDRTGIPITLSVHDAVERFRRCPELQYPCFRSLPCQEAQTAAVYDLADDLPAMIGCVTPDPRIVEAAARWIGRALLNNEPGCR